MKFSIITVNYNNKDGLEKTIKSVFSQKYANYEYIIVDGGSTDGSREILVRYQDCFSWWCSEQDEGVYNAMNKGIGHSTGDYLIFMNSGDCFYDEHVLEKIVLHKPEADIIYGDWIRWYSNKREVYMKAPFQTSISFFYRGDNICHQAMFVRGEIHRKEKYDENYKILADWALWQRLTLKNCSFQYIPLVICYFDATSGLSETFHEVTKAERKLIRSQYPSNLNCILRENKDMYYELKGIGANFRKMFSLRLNHPIYNFFLKISLLPMFIITKLFFNKDFKNVQPK